MMRWACPLFVGLMLISAEPVRAGKFNRVLTPGDPAPAWTGLRGVDGRDHSLATLKDARAVLLVFLSNRCPMTRAYEQRLIALNRKFSARGIKTIAVSIGRSPTDRFEKMKSRARERKYNFPYVIDPSQQIGRRYGATCTPQVFLLDRSRKVVYMGAIDDNVDAAKVEHHYLLDALTAVLAGKKPEVGETLQRGCEIKYAGEKAR